MSGCAGYKDSNTNNVSDSIQNVESNIKDEVPFRVSLDVQALQIRREDTVTAYPNPEKPGKSIFYFPFL